MQCPRLDRREVLKGIAIGTVSLSFVGVASAAGDARYLVRISDRAAERRIRNKDFSIQRKHADGTVLVVTGESNASGDLENIDDVSDAVPDFQFALESPEVTEPGDFDLDDDTNGNGKGDGNGNESGNGNGNDSDENDSEDDLPALFDLQWDKHVTDVEGAHDRATGTNRRLAIIDTGIDDTHQDLPNVNDTKSVTIFDGEQTDHTGDVDAHGTHVAGITAATGHVGVLGTAPDAELVSIRVFEYDDEGNLVAFFGDILLAMEYAADIDADAANMSIGTPPIPPQANAAQYRRVMEPVAQGVTSDGTLLIGSAGNSDANLQQGGYFTLPNSLAGVTSISATGPNDLRTFYSNYGTNEIDVGAPGGGYETLEKTLEDDPNEVEYPFPENLVLSTVPGDQYAWYAGTSMAAPQVTGTAGLVREQDSETTAGKVERAIKDGADLVEGDNDADLGAGRLNANDALDAV